jgi:hypothetical protein
MATIGFFDEKEGEKSSTRLNIFMILVNGLFLVDIIALSGMYLFLISHGRDIALLAIVTAISVLFGVVVAPCITWKQMSKTQENENKEIIEKK